MTPGDRQVREGNLGSLFQVSHGNDVVLVLADPVLAHVVALDRGEDGAGEIHRAQAHARGLVQVRAHHELGQSTIEVGAEVDQARDALDAVLHLVGDLAIGIRGGVTGQIARLDVQAPGGAVRWVNESPVQVERREGVLRVTGLDPAAGDVRCRIRRIEHVPDRATALELIEERASAEE